MLFSEFELDNDTLYGFACALSLITGFGFAIETSLRITLRSMSSSGSS